MHVLDSRRVGDTELRTVPPGTADYRRWIDLSADAYPSVGLISAEQRDAAFEKQRGDNRELEQRLVGAYRDNRLVGGMRVFDFSMCVRGAQLFTGGVGSVAVALEHKQRGIARDLITGFLNEFRERGAALTTLFPFRPDFYRKMGFGYGSKMDQYRIALQALPGNGARERVRRLGPDDLEPFLAIYARAQARVNGLIARGRRRAQERLAAADLYTFGYADGNALAGYLTYAVRLGKPGTVNRDDLFVHELIYETPAALAGLLAFARSQSDQFAALILNTQDPDMHFLLDDPRNGSDRRLYPPAYHETNVQGLGVMYRIVNLAALISGLANLTFGDLDAIVRLRVRDAFFAVNAGTSIVGFRAGRPVTLDAATRHDVELSLDVADLASLIMGSVRLSSLVAYGRVNVSHPDWLARLDAAFMTKPPQCLTRF